jgi:hypothetical protein
VTAFYMNNDPPYLKAPTTHDQANQCQGALSECDA